MLETLRKKLPTQRKLAVIPCPLCFAEAELKRSEDSGLWTRCRSCNSTINEKGDYWLCWYVVALYYHHTTTAPLLSQNIEALDEFARAARLVRPLGLLSLDTQKKEERTRRARMDAIRFLGKKQE